MKFLIYKRPFILKYANDKNVDIKFNAHDAFEDL